MSTTAWITDLQDMPPQAYTFGEGYGRLGQNALYPLGSLLTAVHGGRGVEYSAALYGPAVTYGDIEGTPFELLAHTYSFSGYKNNPMTSAIYTGSVAYIEPPTEHHADELFHNENFGFNRRMFFQRGGITEDFGGGFPDDASYFTQSVGLFVDLQALYAAAQLDWGPAAGYPEPVPPQGYRLEWEYPEAEFLGYEGAADTNASADYQSSGFLATWYHPDRNHYRPLWPDEQVSDIQPARAPSDAGAGQYWAGGSRAVGVVFSETTDNTGPWGYLADAETTDTHYAVVGVTSGLNGQQIDWEALPGGVFRDGQTIGVRLNLRARRYRFVGLSGVRQYPRDDGAGVSSPRVSTLQRATRVFGGYG